MSTSESAHSQADPAETSHISLSAEASNIAETSTPSVKAVVPWWVTLLHNCQRHGITLVICSSGVGAAAFPIAIKFLSPTDSSSQPPAQQQVVSQADYDYQLLELGMTLTDAQATLGRAIEVSRDETTATYKWVNSDGSAIIAVFKGDRLVSKEQSGLQQ